MDKDPKIPEDDWKKERSNGMEICVCVESKVLLTCNLVSLSFFHHENTVKSILLQTLPSSSRQRLWWSNLLKIDTPTKLFTYADSVTFVIFLHFAGLYYRDIMRISLPALGGRSKWKGISLLVLKTAVNAFEQVLTLSISP